MAWAVLQHFDTSKNAECTLESVCGLLHKNLKQDLGAILELDKGYYPENLHAVFCPNK